MINFYLVSSNSKLIQTSPTPPSAPPVVAQVATPSRISRNNNQSQEEKKDEIALKPRPTFRKSMTPVSFFLPYFYIHFRLLVLEDFCAGEIFESKYFFPLF